MSTRAVRWITWFGLIAVATGLYGEPAADKYSQVYDQIRNLQVDVERVARVENLNFRRDAGRFELESGYLYLCSPIQGEVHAAIFVGKGRFSFIPPTAVERQQLERFHGSEEFSQPLRLLFLVFTDSTLTELEQNLRFVSDKARDRVKDHLHYCLKYLVDPDTEYLNSEVARAFLGGSSAGFFYSHFSDHEREPRFWQITPDADEPVSFLHRPGGNHHIHEVVCQFHREDYYTSPGGSVASRDAYLTVKRYVISAELENNLSFSAQARMSIVARRSTQWFDLQLFPGAEVDSVWWEGGEHAEFHSRKGNHVVWVESNPHLAVGKERILNIAYHGEFLRQIGNEHFYNPWPLGWYPQVRSTRLEPALFDCTFVTPKQFDLVSVGNRVSLQSGKNQKTSRWVTTVPVQYALFNVGFLKEYNVGLPGMTVGLWLNEKLSDDYRDRIGQDVLRSSRVFAQLFGECSSKKVVVTNSGQRHGVAAHGYLDLGRPADEYFDRWGDAHLFSAHEVEHQWWGLAVMPATYHDRWISEAFAQYSGLMYLKVTRSPLEFTEKLKQWRQRILDNRNYVWGQGKEAGPIWLGARTASYGTRGDYNLVVYRKGAWVLHMLRCMLINFDDSNEERFLGMMQEFYKTYAGKFASTEDFQEIVEKHAGSDMGWFFDQWVRGTGIPTYRFAYQVGRADDGKYITSCRVEQDNVPNDFGMYVPIQILFENDQWAIVRAWIQGSVSQFDLPGAPSKPKRIVFNPFESVLCRVENKSW